MYSKALLCQHVLLLHVLATHEACITQTSSWCMSKRPLHSRTTVSEELVEDLAQTLMKLSWTS
jgi:hypothetical protein